MTACYKIYLNSEAIVEASITARPEAIHLGDIVCGVEDLT